MIEPHDTDNCANIQLAAKSVNESPRKLLCVKFFALGMRAPHRRKLDMHGAGAESRKEGLWSTDMPSPLAAVRQNCGAEDDFD